MAHGILGRVRAAILRGEYDVTFHALEEMAEDNLVVFDLENAVLDGTIQKIETDDVRGPRYTIVGPSAGGKTQVGVVGRFKETGVFLVVTVYEIA
jgi:hypothetical protein